MNFNDWLGAGEEAGAFISFDLDAESSILHTNPEAGGYLDTMAHQTYGLRIALPMILARLARLGLPATFFVPGFTAECHPAAIEAILESGHEVACHGYLHESVHDVGRDVEAAYIERSLTVFDRAFGIRPVGYRAPKFHLNFRSPSLLRGYGFKYDSSLQAADHPHYIAGRVADAQPSILELPVHYMLDDGTSYLHLPGMRSVPTLRTASEVGVMWREYMEAIKTRHGIATFTIHPYLSGRPSRLETLFELLEVLASDGSWAVKNGVQWFDHIESQDSIEVVEIWERYPPWGGQGSLR